jgi:hypothetical protein
METLWQAAALVRFEALRDPKRSCPPGLIQINVIRPPAMKFHSARRRRVLNLLQ